MEPHRHTRLTLCYNRLLLYGATTVTPVLLYITVGCYFMEPPPSHPVNYITV